MQVFSYILLTWMMFFVSYRSFQWWYELSNRAYQSLFVAVVAWIVTGTAGEIILRSCE